MVSSSTITKEIKILKFKNIEKMSITKGQKAYKLLYNTHAMLRKVRITIIVEMRKSRIPNQQIA